MQNKINIAISRYKQGESIKNICKDLKIGTRTLKKYFILNNIAIRGKSSTTKKYSDEEINKIIKLFNNGSSIREINKITKINRDSISLILQKHNINPTQRKHRLNETIFNVIDTEEKAYWLGFLYANGNIYINEQKHVSNIQITLSINDEKHLIKFKNFLQTDYPIYYENRQCLISNNNVHKACRILISSKQLAKDLISKGCVPNKSLILKFPTINIVPVHLQYHFIRGYFDGDGCITYDNNNIVFQVTGTYNMLENIKRIFNIKSNIKEINNIYDLRCKGNIKALNIFNILYSNANIYLDRKYNKYLLHKGHYKCLPNSTTVGELGV